MFNLQSGIHRQRFPARLTSAQARKLQAQQANSTTVLSSFEDKPKEFSLGGSKHTKAVTGIMVDGINRTVISCGLDGKVKVRSFHRSRKVLPRWLTGTSSGTLLPAFYRMRSIGTR